MAGYAAGKGCRRHGRGRQAVDRQGRAAAISLSAARQPAWAGRRRHRHRQDDHAAGAGRGPRRAGVPVFCADVKGDLSGISQAGRAQARSSSSARPSSASTDFAYQAAPGDLLGRVRPAGPSGARDGGRDGPAAAGADAGAQRHPGRRAQHRLQARRRRGPAAARLQGPDARSCSHVAENARPADHHLRQCQQGHDRHHPAPPADARAAGRRELLRRAGAGAGRPDADHARRAWRRQRAGGRQADPVATALRDVPAVADVASCSRSCRRWATSTSRSWCSSSTRRTCCSTTRPRR